MFETSITFLPFYLYSFYHLVNALTIPYIVKRAPHNVPYVDMWIYIVTQSPGGKNRKRGERALEFIS